MKPILLQNNEPDELIDFVKEWNVRYPIDRWFREKYKIPLNSKKHRSSSILSIRMEFEEDFLYDKELKRYLSEKDKEIKPYIPNRGDWLTIRKAPEMSQKQIDQAFDDIDIDSLEELENGDILI